MNPRITFVLLGTVFTTLAVCLLSSSAAAQINADEVIKKSYLAYY